MTIQVVAIGEQSTRTPIGPIRAAVLIFMSAFGQFLGVVHTFSIGTFLGPISKDTGWSSSAILATLTIVGVVVFFLSPFVGIIVDRIGSRIVGLWGLGLFALALALLSVVGVSIWTWWLVSVFVGVAALVTKPTVWAAGVVTEFNERRGIALSLALCGSSFASALWPLFAHMLIEKFGWRGAYQVLAVIFCLGGIPIFFMLFRPRRAARAETVTNERKPLWSPAVRRILRSGRFFRMALVACLITGATTASVIHFVSMVQTKGITATGAASIAVLIGVASLIGRVSTGFLLDHFQGRVVGSLSFLVPIIGCAILLMNPTLSTLQASIAALTFGFCLGAELDIMAYLIARYFGARNFATLFGVFAGLMLLFTGLGPQSVGRIKDVTGLYDFALVAMIATFIASALLTTSLGRYPPDPDAEPDELASAEAIA